MAEQILIGNFGKGLKLDRLPFVIDNDAFPNMFNFYTWRGRARRKRGTATMGRLQQQVKSVLTTQPPLNWQDGQIMVLDGSGNGSANLISVFTLGSSASIVPGSINLTDGTNTYTDNSLGIIAGAPSGTGTINYATGALTITAGFPTGVVRGVATPGIASFDYFPGLPVMGLRDYVTSTVSSQYPVPLAFDTVYAYQFKQSIPQEFYNVSFYKGTNNPVVWSGQDYQLFWTTNYSGALWATNNKPGFNFVTATYGSGSTTTTVTFNFKSLGVNVTTLIVGDVIWFNEWSGGSTLNGISGTISSAADAVNGNYVVTFASAQTVTGTGIGQLLTSGITGQDGIKWYDGDPTSGTGIPSATTTGWVNFAPPLTATTTPIANLPSALYYLVGALAIIPFKDRLLFASPWVQTSTGAPIQLQDTILWSWNGTPYYTTPVPTNQTANIAAYYVDQTGFGGYLPAGISQPIATVSNNEDVLLVGFGGNGRKTRFVYTGNDIQPFLFYNINSELPSLSTFSAVALDKGAIDIGQYGIAMTDQQSSQRIDLDMPDSVFQIQALNNGGNRVNAIRDFFREWVYFSYPLNNSPWKFPTQTFLFNYRDNTWAIHYENFTAHGLYRAQNKRTWATTGFKSWNSWREPWTSGQSSALFPSVIAGNPQGFVVIKDKGTGEAPSGSISAIANDGNGNTQITSVNHCVSANNPSIGGGDYLLITGCLGTTSINGLIGKVIATPTANTFVLDLPFPAGTYIGGGLFTRLSKPLLQTKQFGEYWQQGRQTRLCAQKYLMDFTTNSQITVNIYLSQDPDDVYNDGNSPEVGQPNGLVYSQILYTCPESTNLGLTPSNINLQMPTASGQYQIWHRLNTSLQGDSVQIGFTLSDSQMRNLTYATAEITLNAMQLTIERGPLLA